MFVAAINIFIAAIHDLGNASQISVAAIYLSIVALFV